MKGRGVNVRGCMCPDTIWAMETICDLQGIVWVMEIVSDGDLLVVAQEIFSSVSATGSQLISLIQTC